MKKVSVVIPNFNGKKYLADCLNSLKKQSFRDFEVIVVDNGSDDGSALFVKENYKNARLLELSENTGFANAANEGIKASKAEFVFLLNNDTICDEDAIKSLVHTMEKSDKIFSVQSKMLQIKEPNNIDDAGDYYCALGWAFSPLKDKPNTKANKKKKLTSACAGACMYRRSILTDIGMFDEAHFCYLEDVDLGIRARLHGYVNLCDPTSIVYHVGSASSGSRHNQFKVELTAANNLYLIYKNMPAWQVILNLPLIILGIIIKHAFYMGKHLGMAHVKGLLSGFSKIFKNSSKKVVFSRRVQKNALKLQLEYWGNLARRLGDF